MGKILDTGYKVAWVRNKGEGELTFYKKQDWISINNVDGLDDSDGKFIL